MIQTHIYTSNNNNSYMYDLASRLSMLIHPQLENAYKNLTNTDSYYLGKYEYLKNHNFFSESKSPNFVTLTDSSVENNIFKTEQIVFEVTDFCNLDCSYCTFGELYQGYEKRNFKNIDKDNAISLLKYILKNRPSHKSELNIGFYGGEPLLNIEFIKHVISIVNQLKSKKKINIVYNMTTNASLIHKHIRFLVENHFQLLISLDGNEENHSYRIFSKGKKNSFKKVIENIDMIQRDYPEYFITHVNFNAVLHNRNSVKDICEFIYTRYHKTSRISELSTANINPCKKDSFENIFHSKSESEDKLQNDNFDLLHVIHNRLSLYQELTDFLKFYSINYYVSNIISLLSNEEKQLPTGTCFPGSKKIFLNNRNKLLPCERVDHKYSIGKVDKSVMIDIHEITRRYNFYYNHISKYCQNCYINRFCGVCLFHLKNLDKLSTEEFVCGNFHDSKDLRNKLTRIFSFLEKYPNDFLHIIKDIIVQ